MLGCVTSTEAVPVQLFTSFTVKVYVPETKEVNVVVDWNVVPSIEYVYGAVPPVALAEIDPFDNP